MSPNGAVPESWLAQLADPDPTIRCSALLDLDPRSAHVPHMEPMLEDPDPMVRVAAAHALYGAGVDGHRITQLVNVLSDALTTGPTQTSSRTQDAPSDVMLMAGSVLVAMGSVAVPHLIGRFDPALGNAPYVVRVLGEIADPEAERFLRQAVDSPHGDVAAEAHDALDALADPSAERPTSDGGD